MELNPKEIEIADAEIKKIGVVIADNQH